MGGHISGMVEAFRGWGGGGGGGYLRSAIKPFIYKIFKMESWAMAIRVWISDSANCAFLRDVMDLFLNHK